MGRKQNLEIGHMPTKTRRVDVVEEIPPSELCVSGAPTKMRERVLINYKECGCLAVWPYQKCMAVCNLQLLATVPARVQNKPNQFTSIRKFLSRDQSVGWSVSWFICCLWAPAKRSAGNEPATHVSAKALLDQPGNHATVACHGLLRNIVHALPVTPSL